ncbi:MAG TPA: hypothetical protein VJ984_00615 [Xanthomonadales bacterium]|nr:hypothetical protein [Xanthomonadales bacterium]
MTTQTLILIALSWLILEGIIGFLRYWRSDRKAWGWWVLANTLSAVMLLFAALVLIVDNGNLLFALCMAGAFCAHLLELKLRPDKTEQ